MNQMIVVGNVGRDAHVKYTQTGKMIADFTLASDESFKKPDGTWEKKTSWHNIVGWSQMAEAAVNLAKKGQKLLVIGYLQTRTWEKKDGTKMYITEVNARNIYGLIEWKPAKTGTPEDRTNRFLSPAEIAQNHKGNLPSLGDAIKARAAARKDSFGDHLGPEDTQEPPMAEPPEDLDLPF